MMGFCLRAFALVSLVCSAAYAADIDAMRVRELVSQGLDATRARQYVMADSQFRSVEIELIRVDDRFARQEMEQILGRIRDALRGRDRDWEILERVERGATDLLRQVDRLDDRRDPRDPRDPPGRNGELETIAFNLDRAANALSMAYGFRLRDALMEAEQMVRRARETLGNYRGDRQITEADMTLARAAEILCDRFMSPDQKRVRAVDEIARATRLIRESDACGGRRPDPRPDPRPIPRPVPHPDPRPYPPRPDPRPYPDPRPFPDPRPYPGPRPDPRPDPRIETRTIRCDSRDHQTARCDTGVIAIDIRVIDERSRADCIYNRTYGLEGNGRFMWVNSGCRGMFAVSYRR